MSRTLTIKYNTLIQMWRAKMVKQGKIKLIKNGAKNG